MPDEQQIPKPSKRPEEQKATPPVPPAQSMRTDKLPAQPNVQTKPSEPKKEKLEFLKRMDVRTMTKDVAELRRQEAAKERQRIEALANQKANQVKQVQEEKMANSLLSGDHPRPPQRNIPSAPSRFDKLFIRALVIFVVLFVIGNIAAAAYYYWFVADRQEAQEQKEQETVKQEEAEPQLPELVIPPSLLNTATAVRLVFSQEEEITQLLGGLLSTEQVEGFTHIVLENEEELRVLQLPDLFDAFEITSPPALYTLLDNDITLFLYTTSEGRKRLGFVARLYEDALRQELIDAASEWESSLEEDTKNLFEIIAERGEKYTPNFRTTSLLEGVLARFQTLSSNDFGIVYGITDNHFIFTSSLESLEAALQALR